MCPQRGLGGKGWTGDQTWQKNLEQIRTQKDVRAINGQVLSANEARRAITSAGGIIFRGPEISMTGTHTYNHLHYLYNGVKHTIEVLPNE